MYVYAHIHPFVWLHKCESEGQFRGISFSLRSPSDTRRCPDASIQPVILISLLLEQPSSLLTRKQ